MHGIMYTNLLQDIYPSCPDVTDVSGRTPLDWAAQRGNTEVVNYLLFLQKPSTHETSGMHVGVHVPYYIYLCFCNYAYIHMFLALLTFILTVEVYKSHILQ